MNNFIDSNNGIIIPGNINKTSINNIYNYKDNDTKNNTMPPYQYNYTKTNNTNYLLQYYNNSSVKYTIAFTEKFKDYKVEIADIIASENNNNISYIYANIVPINSSKILLGNQFTLDYKSTYRNEMKSLIGDVKLVALDYKFSGNSTLNKFGIEYSHIAMAMNSMLGFTNNHVKNINVNGTYSIILDFNWWCVLALSVFIASMLLAIIFPLALGASLIAIIAYGSLTGFVFTGALIGTLYTCFG